MNAQIKAILAHMTIIGWLIALIINNDNKEEFASFYMRQTLGLYLTAMLLTFIPFFGWIIGLILFVFWIISLYYAIQNSMIEVPLVGRLYQDLFRGI